MSHSGEDLFTTLAAVEYPGRGLAIGRDLTGSPFALYWLTGRSPSSRDRQLLRPTDDRIVVTDTGGAETDPLRHYVAYESGAGIITVGNGTHVSDIAATVQHTRDLAAALTDHSYEPDAPIRTPRIAGLAAMADGMLAVSVGSARSCPPCAADSEVITVSAADVPVGWALTVTTYNGSADQIRTDGSPRWLPITAKVEELHQQLWSVLDERFRVAVCCVALTENTALGSAGLIGLNH
jgi:IMP cyclohydrolase